MQVTDQPVWSYRAVLRCLTPEEGKYLEWMVDGANRPRRQFWAWTEKQVVARCRNMAEQRVRRYAHGTGAVA
jgi:hypothetical protein